MSTAPDEDDSGPENDEAPARTNPLGVMPALAVAFVGLAVLYLALYPSSTFRTVVVAVLLVQAAVGLALWWRQRS